MNRKKRNKIDGEKIFSVVASLAIVAAIVVGVISVIKSINSDDKPNYIDLNVADNETNDETKVVAQKQTEKATEHATQKAVEKAAKETEEVTEAEIKETQNKATENKEAENKEAGNKETEIKEAAATQADNPIEVQAPIYNFNENSSLGWPVDGDIVLGYNMDNTIYFPTLDQYKCNPAIIIGAASGSEVKAAAAGVVEDIYEDSIIGTTMIISVGDGYKLTYGQLSDLSVGISDNIEAGTVIGKVAEPTKYFNVEGSNLYFELTKDGSPVDPMLFMAE